MLRLMPQQPNCVQVLRNELNHVKFGGFWNKGGVCFRTPVLMIADYAKMVRVVCTPANNNTINIVMKRFSATVRASGVIVTTVVYAENINFATKILQTLFGTGNVISIPRET